jgi:osmotically-inducible protein OsmY
MRKAIHILWCLATLPLLSACFPLVATGVGAGAMMIEDRRSTGSYVDDEAIERRISWRIGDHYGRDTHVDVTSFNRVVLISGQVQDDAARQAVEKIAREAEDVRSLQNELTIGQALTIGAHSHDALITSKVKARFLDANKFYPNHVKVITENKVVYLMGLVKHQEADAATEIARNTGDVSKVVRIFEYID